MNNNQTMQDLWSLVLWLADVSLQRRQTASKTASIYKSWAKSFTNAATTDHLYFFLLRKRLASNSIGQRIYQNMYWAAGLIYSHTIRRHVLWKSILSLLSNKQWFSIQIIYQMKMILGVLSGTQSVCFKANDALADGYETGKYDIQASLLYGIDLTCDRPVQAGYFWCGRKIWLKHIRARQFFL